MKRLLLFAIFACVLASLSYGADEGTQVYITTFDDAMLARIGLPVGSAAFRYSGIFVSAVSDGPVEFCITYQLKGAESVSVTCQTSNPNAAGWASARVTLGHSPAAYTIVGVTVTTDSDMFDILPEDFGRILSL